MELTTRARGDEFAPPGRLRQLTQRIAARPGVGDCPVLCIHGFDARTRQMPFIFWDRWMVPAGLRAVAAAFHESGFERTRAVFQLWCPNVRPSACRIDERPIEILAVSAMQIHSTSAYRLIEDAWAMGPDRPLIIVGGPKAIYEPDHCFGLGARGDLHSDVAVLGEELILLELLDRITEHRGSGETMLRAFQRCRAEGLLDDIPGLVYLSDERDERGRPWLVHTGVQRLIPSFDELPHVAVGFRLLEPPHKNETLSARPLPANKVHRHAQVASMVITRGCKFRCSYCPIPAYTQRTWRSKSPERVVDEFKVLREQFNISHFFGTDDNFFNRRETAEGILSALASAEMLDPRTGRTKKTERRVRLGTEVTEYDLYRNRDLLPLAFEAGVKGLWMGIEDLSGGLVKKGQSAEKTVELFRLMLENEILPMVMLMHYDGQPLRTGGNDLRGLMNQVAFVQRHGAVSVQCLLHSPAIGTKDFERMFREGVIIRSVGGVPVDESYYDATHAIATSNPNPAQMQINMLRAYARFFNPIQFLKESLRPDKKRFYKRRPVKMQFVGMAGLVVTVAKNLRWLHRLSHERIEYWTEPPESKFPMKYLDGARHDSKRNAAAAERQVAAAS